MNDRELDSRFMLRALALAERGQGAVEPNPMVGCVIARGETVLGEGWHSRFGSPHAEIEALARAGNAARGGTLYVTLEPCCHFGKTPPCTNAILSAGISRVVVAQRDPFAQVNGAGVDQLVSARIPVEVGLLEHLARRLNAPYLKLVSRGLPWILAKWAMTLDGRIASRRGDSRWVSNESSRTVGHQLRGRVDAIMIGRRTAEIDNPLLTARPPGPRLATRIVLDSHASLPLNSQLVQTATRIPTLVAAGPAATTDRCNRLRDSGCEVVCSEGSSRVERLRWLLAELGRRRMTNVLVEGGGTLLGTLFDAAEIDEVHVFVAPKLVGGQAAPCPLAGEGLPSLGAAQLLEQPESRSLDGDVYISGRIRR